MSEPRPTSVKEILRSDFTAIKRWIGFTAVDGDVRTNERGRVTGPAKDVLFTKRDIRYIEQELPLEADGVSLEIYIEDGGVNEDDFVDKS
jgi:hypothetical protein